MFHTNTQEVGAIKTWAVSSSIIWLLFNRLNFSIYSQETVKNIEISSNCLLFLNSPKPEDMIVNPKKQQISAEKNYLNNCCRVI